MVALDSLGCEGQCSHVCDHFVWCLEMVSAQEMVSWLDEFQFSSVAQSCPTLCDPMNRSMPGLSVHHQLPEFTQTHVH